MKLRNKKTGEIAYVTIKASYNGGEFQIHYYPIDNTEDMHFKEYRSISEFNEEWEDYEEPKVYYYISDFGAIRECEIGKFPEDEEDRKSIGNYFSSREEAEKAVEKLKNWKLLKDKGFKFDGWFRRGNGADIIYCDFGIAEASLLNLLFRGKE